MNSLIRRTAPTAALALALCGSFTVSATGAATVPAPLVSASQARESTIVMAFANPKYPVVITAEQQSLGADVNAERAKRGLPALVIDDTLNRFAYAKAFEMASRGYFGHTDPNGIAFQDRLRAWHWPNPYAAENIAFDRDESHAHAAFMNSAPHAANLLDPNERRMGIAVVTVNTHETFYVEDFSN